MKRAIRRLALVLAAVAGLVASTPASAFATLTNTRITTEVSGSTWPDGSFLQSDVSNGAEISSEGYLGGSNHGFGPCTFVECEPAFARASADGNGFATLETDVRQVGSYQTEMQASASISHTYKNESSSPITFSWTIETAPIRLLTYGYLGIQQGSPAAVYNLSLWSFVNGVGGVVFDSFGSIVGDGAGHNLYQSGFSPPVHTFDPQATWGLHPGTVSTVAYEFDSFLREDIGEVILNPGDTITGVYQLSVSTNIGGAEIPPSCNVWFCDLWHTGARTSLNDPLGSSYAPLVLRPSVILDTDGDLVADALDNCPYRANADQADANGDGVGDACQCADMNGDGFVNGADLTLYKRHFGGLPSPFSTDRCGVSPAPDGGACDGADLTIIKRYFGGLPPGLTNTCSAYVGP